MTQNSESIVQSSEDPTATATDDSEAVSIDMNWNIAEQLPEERNCRAEFEAIITMFMDSLVNQSTAADALRAMSFQVYEIVQRLHKGFAPGKISPALQFCNALVKILSTIKAIEDEVNNSFSHFLFRFGHYMYMDAVSCRCNRCAEICCVWLALGNSAIRPVGTKWSRHMCWTKSFAKPAIIAVTLICAKTETELWSMTCECELSNNQIAMHCPTNFISIFAFSVRFGCAHNAMFTTTTQILNFGCWMWCNGKLCRTLCKTFGACDARKSNARTLPNCAIVPDHLKRWSVRAICGNCCARSQRSPKTMKCRYCKSKSNIFCSTLSIKRAFKLK